MKKFILHYCLLMLCHIGVYAQQYNLDSTTVMASTLTDQVNVPWDIAWGPDHMIWMTDGAHIKRVNPTTGEMTTPWTSKIIENGVPKGYVLSLSFHPDFFHTPQVFAVISPAFYYNAAPKADIYRFDYSFTGDSLYNQTLLLSYNTFSEHCGGRILTTQDGKLMISTPDFWYELPESSLNGRMLRMNLDGSIPADNPYGNYTWTTGHRNSQGIVQTPNGMIYASEHGQWSNSQDELNLITPGNHYGWPAYDGYECSTIANDSCTSPTFTHVLPIEGGSYTPSGIDYYNHEAIPEFGNSILVSCLNMNRLQVMQLNNAGNDIVENNAYFIFDFARIRDVCTSPSGKIYMIAKDRYNIDYFVRPVVSEANITIIENINYDHCTPTSSVMYHPLCTGESVNIDGVSYFGTQNVVEYLDNAAGCDSLVIHVLEELYPAKPSITTQLSGVSKCLGDDHNLNVAATGTGVLNYTWKNDDINLVGSSATYALTNLSAQDEGKYTVTITDDCGSITSDTAIVELKDSIQITSQPQATSINCDDRFDLSVSAEGSNLTYQWQHNGSNIDNATNATYSVLNAASVHAGDYVVTIDSDCGTEDSESASVEVNCTLSSTDPALDDLIVNIHPNPSHGRIHIQSNERPNKALIVHQSGKVISEFYPATSEFDIQITEHGLYFIQLVFNNQSVTKTIIVE